MSNKIYQKTNNQLSQHLRSGACHSMHSFHAQNVQLHAQRCAGLPRACAYEAIHAQMRAALAPLNAQARAALAVEVHEA